MVEEENVNSTVTVDVLTGYLIGGHVMRLCHGHDESLTIPGAEKSEDEQRLVINSVNNLHLGNQQVLSCPDRYFQQHGKSEILSFQGSFRVKMLFNC